MNFRFDAVIVIRDWICVLFFDIYRNLLFKIDRIADWDLNRSFVYDGDIDSHFDRFESLFDYLVNKGDLLNFIDDFEYFFEKWFLDDSIN